MRVFTRKFPPITPFLLVGIFTILTIGFGFLLIRTGWTDSLIIVLVTPILWAAQYYRRRYCWLMLLVLGMVSVWVTYNLSMNFQEALQTITVAAPTLVVLVFIIHRLNLQRDRFEQALVAAKDEYRVVADFAYHLEYWTNPDGSFRYISPSCEQITGYPPQAFIVDKDFFCRLVPPDDQKKVVMIDDPQKTVHDVDFQFVRKDGVLRHGSLVSRPVHSAQGTYLGRRGTILDITERRSMEAALQLSTERLRLSIEENEGGIWDWDVQSGRITFSPEYARYLGMRREQIRFLNRDDGEAPQPVLLRKRVTQQLTGDFYNLVHPEDLGAVLENLHAYLSGKSPKYEATYRIHTRDGRWVWILDRARVHQRDESGHPVRITGIHINITNSKNTEQALQQSEIMFRQIGQTIREVLIIIDRGTTDVVYISPNVVELTGIPAERLVAMQSEITNLFLPDDLQQVIEMFDELNEQERIVWRELRFRYPDGDIGWLQVRGYPVHDEKGNFSRIVLVAEDITQQKAAEAALRESEQRYRDLIEQQGEGVIIADTKEGIVYANPAAGEIFGVPHTKLVSRLLQDFFDEDQFRILLSQTAFRRIGRESSYELNLRRPDGELRTILITATPRFDLDGNFMASIGVFRDITQRKADEDKLRYLSSHDALTEVYNRAYFENAIDQMEARGRYPVSVIMIDLDGLKGINDQYGHHVGDELLQNFSGILMQIVREEDLVARLGGDEFTILMPGVDNDNLTSILGRLKQQVDNFNQPEQHAYVIQYSVGGATSREPATLRETLRDADLNMYHTKRQRKLQTG